MPLPGALAESLKTGKPFGQAYEEAQREMRETRKGFEKQNPVAGTLLETAGGLASAPLLGSAFKTGPGAATLARNIGAGTVIGGVQGALMTDGDLQDRLKGAKAGAVTGGALSAAAPAIGAAGRRAGTALFPTSSVDRLAGQTLREQAGIAPGAAVPVAETSPVAGQQLTSAQAFNSPGFAAQERRLNSLSDAAALEQRTATNNAVAGAATAPQPGGQLANATAPTEASQAVVSGAQQAYDVLRQDLDRRWSHPALSAVRPDVDLVQDRVRRSIAAQPQSVQQIMANNGEVQGALNDLMNLRPGASLVDINNARSELLATSRALPMDQRKAKMGADIAAQAVFDAIESDPALRTDPVAMAAYDRAKEATAQVWAQLSKPQFSRMVQATVDNKKGLDPATVAGGMFNLTAGTEKSPQMLSKVNDMLGEVQRQWGLFENQRVWSLSHPNGPTLDPAAAAQAQNALTSGARDFVVNSLLESSRLTTQDLNGTRNLNLNVLSKAIDKNRDWMQRSGIFTPSQMDLIGNWKTAADLAARSETENLRGGKGSQTFERLMGNNYADVFMGPIASRLFGTIGGAAVGAAVEHLFPSAGIGGLIGLEIGGVASGPTILRSIYRAPRELLQQRLEEAIRSPVIASDLMKKAGSKINPQTENWLRSIVASVPAGQAARTVGGENPEFGTPQ